MLFAEPEHFSSNKNRRPAACGFCIRKEERKNEKDKLSIVYLYFTGKL